jgi:WD40 repeat protein
MGTQIMNAPRGVRSAERPPLVRFNPPPSALRVPLLFFSLVCFLVFPAAAAQEKITYEEQVLPVLRNHCLKCHNPDKNSGDLDLSSFNGVLKGAGSGQVTVPGDADSSKLHKVITHAEEPAMPPNSPRIPENEIDLIRGWIDGGLLEKSGSKSLAASRPKVDLAMGKVSKGKPEGPPPMPEDWLLEPVARSDRSTALIAITTSPWAPLLAVGASKQLLLYHSETFELLGVMPFTNGQPVSLNFSRNSRLLLAAGGRGGHSGRVQLFNLTSGDEVISVGDEYDAVLAADISSDQARIALGGPGRQVKVYSTRDGELLHAMKKHTDWITALEYSPDSVLLATGDRNGGVYIWEAESGQEFYQLNGHRGAITAVSWRPDSDAVVTASEDGTMKLWEMHEGKQVRSWTAHNGGVLSAGFTHDGRIVSCGRDNQITIWDAGGNRQRSFEFAGDLPVRARFSHDGAKVFATSWSGKIGAWHAADGGFLGELSPNPPALAGRIELARKELELQLAKNAAASNALCAAEAAQARQALASVDTVLRTWQAAQVNASVHRARAALETRRRENEAAQLRAQELEAKAATMADELQKHEKALALARLRVEGFQNVLKFDQGWHDEVREELARAEQELAAIEATLPAGAGEGEGSGSASSSIVEEQQKLSQAREVVATRTALLSERAAEVAVTREKLAQAEANASALAVQHPAVDQRARSAAAAAARQRAEADKLAEKAASEEAAFNQLLAEYRKLKP